MKSQKYIGAILFLVSIIAVLFDKAFLLNPFVLIVLYFSFYYGLSNYLVNSLAMIVVAFIMSRNYALEIAVIIITYLFSTCLFSLLFKKPSIKYYSLITINILLIIVTMIFSFSIDNICNALISVLFQFFIIKSFESFMLGLEDDTHQVNIIEIAGVLFFALSLTTFNDSVALVLVRTLLLFIVMKTKREITILTLLFIIIYTSVFTKFSIVTTISMYFPLILLCFIKKARIVTYGVLSFAFLFISPIPFYMNVSFYGIMASIIIYESIRSTKIDDFFELINNMPQSYKIKENKYAYAMNKIEAINNYVALVDDTNVKELTDPFNQIINDVLENVCKKCDHYQYCSLKNDLRLLFKSKLTSKDRALISEKCITPYKLTMALANNFKVYQKEQYYYSCYVDANKRYKHLIKCLEKPLNNCSLKLKKNNDNIKQKILESGLHYYKCWMNNGNIEVIFNIKDFKEDDERFEEFVNKYLANSYQKHVHKQNILSSTIQVSYILNSLHNYDYGIVSKGLNDSSNGDNYLITTKNNELIIILCDGMGHGVKAEECSKFLLKAIKNHLELETNLIDMVGDLNNLMLFHNDKEFYSTMDFIKINLISLRTTLLKSGAFTTYLVRNHEITKINKHNLPLGIVNDVTYDISAIELEKDDILVIVSDGIGERIEEDVKVLTITPNVSMSQLARNIFTVLFKNKPMTDDSTIITIKIL